MKKINRISSLILLLALLLSLTACGKKEEAVAESETPVTQSAVESKPVEKVENSNTEAVVAPQVMNAKQYNCTVNSSDGLSLRLGPGTDYEIVTVIPDKTPLIELANQNGWIYVDYEGAQGWVFGQYITYVEQ